MTFDEFVTFRLGALLRYATVVTCDPHLAEDIVQGVLVRAHGRWDHPNAIRVENLVFHVDGSKSTRW